MEKNEPIFPWVPDYDHDFIPSGSSDDLGLMESGLVAVANLAFSTLELYLLIFFTYVLTGLLVA